MSSRRTRTTGTPKSKNLSHQSPQNGKSSNKMPASTAVPPLPKIDPSIMRPATKSPTQPAASSDKAMAHLTRAADEEDLYQWSRQLSSSIPRDTLKEARKAVGAGADSKEFRNFVRAHHISSKPVELDRGSSARMGSQGSDQCNQFTLPPVDSQPSIGRGYGRKVEKSTGEKAPRKMAESEASHLWADMVDEDCKSVAEAENQDEEAAQPQGYQPSGAEPGTHNSLETLEDYLKGKKDKRGWCIGSRTGGCEPGLFRKMGIEFGTVCELGQPNEQDSQTVNDDQKESGAESEDEEDEVVIITGDEDTKSSWTLPTPENSENSVSSALSSGSEQAQNSTEEDPSAQAEDSSAGQVSASTLQYWADHPELNLDYEPPDPRWSKIDFNESLLELDSRTGLYHSRIPNEISFVYERTVPTREVTFTLNDSGSIANARSFCQTSPHANEMLISPYEPLLIIVKFSKPSTLFPLYPIGVAIASTSARTLKELVETALAMRMGGGKWKARAMHYEWTEAMAKKAREEGVPHLLDSVLYSRWAERDREEEAILDAELFGGKNGDGKQLQEAVKSQEKTVELQQDGLAEDGAEQTAEEIATGHSVEAQVQETDLEQDATALEIASEGKMMLLAGVLGLLLTAYMILYC